MLSEIHRVLLTYLRSVKSISLPSLLDAFRLICQRLDNGVSEKAIIPNRDILEEYIRDINAEITKQGFKIDRKNDELNGTLYFVFTNTVCDEIIKNSTTYTVPELVTIKMIIEEIVESPDYAFSNSRIRAQQTVSGCLNKSLKESSTFVDKLIDDGWFDATLDDKLVLSIKSLCELKQYLIETYGSSDSEEGKLLICPQCKELVTLGFCTAQGEGFHRKCYDIYCRNNGLEKVQENQLSRVGPDPTTL
ncbi:hypothetical protein KGF56_002462 [Candida oxycetoniae]|uniref:Non-structural maintenance of chromosomes element 1 homolog n=1 Tax=Candida oxycetoniae TaxID=497107 RepID=A0AAI9SX71_9ASCO|nr:uncharacterized protein KGF56_002462 [Candida oxycetoniae]KAI3404759.2 hypothetical protein KGF56_002462 [Candida oxycetoniae]